MDINWVAVLLHCVAARFRGPARVVLLFAAWLAQAQFGNSEAAPGRDESVPMRHAVVEVTVTRHAGIRAVEIVVTRV